MPDNEDFDLHSSQALAERITKLHAGGVRRESEIALLQTEALLEVAFQLAVMNEVRRAEILARK